MWKEKNKKKKHYSPPPQYEQWYMRDHSSGFNSPFLLLRRSPNHPISILPSLPPPTWTCGEDKAARDHSISYIASSVSGTGGCFGRSWRGGCGGGLVGRLWASGVTATLFPSLLSMYDTVGVVENSFKDILFFMAAKIRKSSNTTSWNCCQRPRETLTKVETTSEESDGGIRERSKKKKRSGYPVEYLSFYTSSELVDFCFDE